MGKKLDDNFYKQTRTFKKIFHKQILTEENSLDFELYIKDSTIDQGIDWIHESVIRIGNYYYITDIDPTVYKFDLLDIPGKDKELFFYPGNFGIGPPHESFFIIRLLKDATFSVSDFSEVSDENYLINPKKDDSIYKKHEEYLNDNSLLFEKKYNYYKISDLRKDYDQVSASGEILVMLGLFCKKINNHLSSYVEFVSYKRVGKGFKKSKTIKLIKVYDECVG